MLRALPIIISCLLVAAHYMRMSAGGLVIMWLSAPILLFFRRRWVPAIVTLLLIAGASVWGLTTLRIWQARARMGAPRPRMAFILGGVALFTAASALVFLTKTLRKRYRSNPGSSMAGAAAFILTFLTFAIVHYKVGFPVTLLGRFMYNGGWLEAFWLSVYAGILADILTNDPLQTKKLRPILWGGFSLIFFTQLILGLTGMSRFLMTGALHLPVPALIVAGPIYRGAGFFMPILFGVTLLLTGPAWCSWLCYIGSWDDGCSRLRKRVDPLPHYRKYLRVITLACVILAAVLLRYFGVKNDFAVYAAGAFGVIGVLVMLTWSRRTGAMTHCTAYCPIGLLATRIGKINPFRIAISEKCDDCGSCTKVCRYDSLSPDDIKRRAPGEACTLCGDCVSACKGENITYKFCGLSPAMARNIFITLIVSLHAVFLGIARI